MSNQANTRTALGTLIVSLLLAWWGGKGFEPLPLAVKGVQQWMHGDNGTGVIIGPTKMLASQPALFSHDLKGVSKIRWIAVPKVTLDERHDGTVLVCEPKTTDPNSTDPKRGSKPYTGKLTLILIGESGGTFLTLQHECEVVGDVPAPEPDPKPGPKPDPVVPAPTGFAGEVAAKAKGLPANDCRSLASNYQVVASMIAAGGITRLEDAVAKIAELNKALALDKPTWTPFATWLGAQFDAKAQKLADAKTLMDEVAAGLNYAGGAK